jgi:hypothetical protein
MARRRLAGFGLVLGLVALSGCVPPPPPQVAVAPASVAVAPPPALVMPPSPPPAYMAKHHVPVVHYAATAPHPVKHHHRVRLTYAPPGSICGSDANPCNQQHIVVPLN